MYKNGNERALSDKIFSVINARFNAATPTVKTGVGNMQTMTNSTFSRACGGDGKILCRAGQYI